MKFSTKKLRQIEKESELGSIDVINKFKSDKKKALRELDQDQYNEEVYQMIKEKLAILEDELLGKEMKLVEMLSEATGEFKQSLDTLSDDMKKMTETFIEDVLHTTQLYHDELEKYCKAYQLEASKEAELNQNTDQGLDNVDDDLNAFILDEDMLNQCLETTKDQQHSRISDKETEIIQALMAEKERFLKKIGEEQHTRNRDTVMEIIGLVKEMRDQIDREINERMSEDNYD